MGLTLRKSAMETPGHRTVMTGLPEYLLAGRIFVLGYNVEKMLITPMRIINQSIKPAAILFLLLQTSIDAWAQRTYVLRFATLAPEGTTWMNVMDQLHEEIRHRTNDRLRFKFYPRGVQGDDLKVVRKMKLGQIDCAGLTGKGLGDISPQSRILELPFLFRGEAEVDWVVEKSFDYFSRIFLEKNFVLLGWAHIGFVYVFSNIPIERSEDFARARMWTWKGDRLAAETFRVFGITPIPLMETEVMGYLTENRIDAFYNSPFGAIALGWFSRVKFMTDLPIAYGSGAVLIARKSFERLPPDLQVVLKESCADHLKRLVLEIRRENNKSKSVIAARGIKVIRVSDEKLISEFRTMGTRVRENLTGELFSPETLVVVQNALQNSRAQRE
jgi:TRAP-type C4-dicarboxylate transport system substrate-binding protein